MVPSHTVSLEMGPDTKSTSLKETEVPRYKLFKTLILQNIENVCLANEVLTLNHHKIESKLAYGILVPHIQPGKVEMIYREMSLLLQSWLVL